MTQTHPNTSATGLPKQPQRPSLVTRNIRLGQMRTSVRLERIEWQALDVICRLEGVDRHGFAAVVQADPRRSENTLTSRLRSAILAYYMAAAGLEHHSRASSSSRGKVANEIRVDTTTNPATAAGSRL
ncbi:ribbon-helix-helix domain-containing protein [Ferrovibrio sp.]|uniref:ribbon-helix-helix domain-containing protein n=1 Tax=Ferrovibrio sp. TaxID=1917215 RepID=UPI001B4E1617|nr:ribbon-helix-helix domain-containing protein [Ferrovibrio sp.]MBP7064053.1 ribbon-helix-helix domain-containing protein [Ferrovibrio sp.]